MKHGPITENNRKNFNIGSNLMPLEVIRALIAIKIAAAKVNSKLKKIPKNKSQAIINVGKELLSLSDFKLQEYFPLKVWQTGSGTQTNMNVNEVISLKSKKIKLHPNDDVNQGQSSNDVFPTAMNIAICLNINNNLIPSLKKLSSSFKNKQQEFKSIKKIGRTHLMDAVPMYLGEEFSAFNFQINLALKNLNFNLKEVSSLAIGGTAVGNGINTHPKFSKYIVKELSQLLNFTFTEKRNKFAGLSTHDDLAYLSSHIKVLSTSIFKIASDLRFLCSGPRAGIYELKFQANEAGSSIMPGKINPTQIEALCMICTQVLANESAIAFANSQGQLQLNTYKPVIIYNLIQSVELLSAGINSFCILFLDTLEANHSKIAKYVEHSLMIATKLNPIFGYDLMSQVVKSALEKDISLKEELINRKLMTSSEFISLQL